MEIANRTLLAPDVLRIAYVVYRSVSVHFVGKHKVPGIPLVIHRIECLEGAYRVIPLHDCHRAPPFCSGSDQDFHFAILADIDYISNHLHLDPFVSFFPSRATPAAQEGATPGCSRRAKAWKCFISSGFSDTLSVSFPFARLVSPAAAYPVGTASAAIRRTMLTNSRRVRWLSARSSQ